MYDISLLCRVESPMEAHRHSQYSLPQKEAVWCIRACWSAIFTPVFVVLQCLCPARTLPDCPSFMRAVVGLMQKLRRRNRRLVGCVPWRWTREIPAKYWCHIPVKVRVDSGVKPLPAELSCHGTFLCMA